MRILIVADEAMLALEMEEISTDAGHTIVSLARALLSDKVFDTDAILDDPAARNIQAVISPKSTRKVHRSYDKALYKERNLIEQFFKKLTLCRGIRPAMTSSPSNATLFR